VNLLLQVTTAGITIRKWGIMIDTAETESGINILKDLTQQLATEAGIKLSNVLFDDGRPLGVRDIHLLSVTTRGKTAVAKINHEEIKCGKAPNELTRAKIRGAIDRLKVMLEG
jgi:hypothetical protein